jgi:hypothetical protein
MEASPQFPDIIVAVAPSIQIERIDMKIGHQKDFWGGVLFAVIGARSRSSPRAQDRRHRAARRDTRWARPRAWARRSFRSGWDDPARPGRRHRRQRLSHKDAGRFGVPKYHWGPILWVLGSGRDVRPDPQGGRDADRRVLLVIVSGVGDPEGFPLEVEPDPRVSPHHLLRAGVRGGPEAADPAVPDIESHPERNRLLPRLRKRPWNSCNNLALGFGVALTLTTSCIASSACSWAR